MKEQVVTPKRLGVEYEDVYLKMSDGTRLHGWRLLTPHPKGTILFFHGNAENISTHFASVFWLPKYGYEVFLFDYRGYGLSEGTPSIDLVIQDAVEQVSLIKNKFGVKNSDMLIFGQSLGGAVAINTVARLADQPPIRGLVFDSAFSGFREIARDKLNDLWLTWAFQWPLSLAFTNGYNPTKAIKQIKQVPVLGIHGDSDNIIPIKHGLRLYDAANEPKQFWEIKGGKHIQSMMRPEIRKRFVQYLDSLYQVSGRKKADVAASE